MKTIEEGMNEAYKKTNVNAYFGNGFICGVKFAQEWIPVNEELPDLGSWVNLQNEKGDYFCEHIEINDKKCLAYYMKFKKYINWRPI